MGEIDLVRLLLGLARLGESDLESWWGSQLFTPAGRYVLPHVFPRTWRAAGGELLLQSAARWHEERVGSSHRLIHLYSDLLPGKAVTAAWSAEQKTVESPDPLWEELASWVTADQARSALSDWVASKAPDAPPAAARAGVAVLGRVERGVLEDDEQVVDLCTRLVRAFLADSHNVPCYELVV